ncbi:MAG: hypothetical protein Q9175_001640 [Cornicularia normoerica]
MRHGPDLEEMGGTRFDRVNTFAAYLQKESDEESWDVNGAMLSSFLDALEITRAFKKFKRVILTTGTKQYGIHLGYPKQPMEESDRWIEGDAFLCGSLPIEIVLGS